MVVLCKKDYFHRQHNLPNDTFMIGARLFHLPFCNDVALLLSIVFPILEPTNAEFPSSSGTTEITNVNTKNIQIFIFTKTL